MSRPADHSHSVRSVQLPSGKTIEVVYFPDTIVGPPAAEVAPERSRDEGNLHHCRACDGGLVHPTDWAAVGSSWEITLRCPSCEHVRTGVFNGTSVARFDDELDRGVESLIDDLRRLMHANMEEAVERFAVALHADAILPEDF